MKHEFYKMTKGAFIASILCMCSFAVLNAQTNISDEAGLKAMAGDLAGSYKLTSDITLTEEWEPIGSNDEPFTGTLDGDGHVIKNLVIAKEGTDRVGFFGVTNGATIKKIGFENVNVTVDVTNGGGADVGVVIGRSKSTTITESYVSGGYLEGRDHVGTFAGGCTKDGDGSPVTLIQDCYSNITIVTRQWQVGGITGTIDFTKINRCYFSGTAECLNLGGGAVGGIAGLVDGGGSLQNEITNCVALSASIKGGNVPGRVLGNWNSSAATLTNNYALTTTPVSPSPSGDPVADGVQGADVDKATAKTAAFYATTLGWDMTNTWVLHPAENGNEGIYPVLKWQTGKINASIMNAPAEPVFIVFGNEYRCELFGSHGQKVVYSSGSESILYPIVEGTSVVFLTGEDGMVSGNTVGIGSSVATSYMNEAKVEFPVTVKSTEEMKVNVGTPEEFNDIRDMLEMHYVLTADIDLSGYDNFEPIGTKVSPFKGKLLGNGHKITGLKTEGGNVKGLFGYANGATFENLTLEAPQVSGSQDVGGLLGKCVGTKIDRVAVTSAYISGVDHVGGIAGGTDAGAVTTITNCYVTTGVEGMSITLHQMGGLLGVAQSTVIEKSYFNGMLSAGADSETANVGGFIGLVENGEVTIRNSASVAYSITAPLGAAHFFVARGDSPLAEETNLYYLAGASVVYDTERESPGFPAPAEELGRTFDVFSTPTFYVETLGWDFTNTWEFVDGTPLPVLKKVATSIEKTTPQGDAKVYSSEGNIVVKTQKPATVFVYDLTGRPVETLKNVSDVSIPLAQGVYLVKVVSESTTVVKVLNK